MAFKCSVKKHVVLGSKQNVISLSHYHHAHVVPTTQEVTRSQGLEDFEDLQSLSQNPIDPKTSSIALHVGLHH